MACEVPEPCKLHSPYSYQKRFLRTHKEDDLAPHPVVYPVLLVGDTEFPHAPGFQSLDPIFRVSKQGPRFTAEEEDGGDKSLVELVLACGGCRTARSCLVWPLLPLLRQF